MNISAAYGSVMSVPKSEINQGMTYLFSVMMTVTVDGQFYQSRAGYMKTVNYLPYGGNCGISKTKGMRNNFKFRKEFFHFLKGNMALH